jgi:chorismate synthase
MLRYFTAGESHGKALVALVDGFPAGVELRAEPIDAELHRRQGGYGRGGRQKLETDRVDILTGIWRGHSIGSPIALMVPNHDYKIEQMDDLPRPRPGHGDLNGSIKYLGSIRGVLERASARETTMRVAAGSLAKQLLEPFGIAVFGYVIQVGPIAVSPRPGTIAQQRALRDASELYTLDPDRDAELKNQINVAAKQGDTVGGIVEVRARNGIKNSMAAWLRPLCRCRQSRASRSEWGSRPPGISAPKCTIRSATIPLWPIRRRLVSRDRRTTPVVWKRA